MQSVGELTKTMRKTRRLSQQSFGQAISEKIIGSSITRQAVIQWEQGKTRPDMRLLLASVLLYEDWRQEWALSCLKVIMGRTLEGQHDHALQ
jgi:transcriptional regulator with XRE-family HTH domain